MASWSFWAPLFSLSLLLQSVLAHEHHGELSDDNDDKPIDAVLWIHMLLQGFVWGVLFPVGMVLGLSKSRWHVPLQVRTSFSLLRRVWGGSSFAHIFCFALRRAQDFF